MKWCKNPYVFIVVVLAVFYLWFGSHLPNWLIWVYIAAQLTLLAFSLATDIHNDKITKAKIAEWERIRQAQEWLDHLLADWDKPNQY